MTILIDQASAALRAGLTITSTSNSALNGIYDVGTGTQARIAFFTKCVANGSFPGNQLTLNWTDASGIPHNFTINEYKAFAVAVAAYATALQAIIMTNTGSLPANSSIID